MHISKTSSVKIPLFGVIFFSLLLAAASFYSGFSFFKSKSTFTVDAVTAINAKTVFAAQKSNKPELKFFVMSFCPYGNQMEDILRPVFDLVGKQADIKPQYIFEKISDLSNYCKANSGDPTQCATYVKNQYFKDEAECKNVIAQNLEKCQDTKEYIKSGDNTYYASLHGRQEANQDVREICAWNQTEDKKIWWNFVGNVNKSCTAQNADSCWEDQAKKAGLDTTKITDCFNKDAINLIEKEIAVTTQYKVSGSPTLILNGVNFPPETAYTQDNTGNIKIGNKVFTQDKYRTPNVIKEAICASTNKPGKECNTVLPDPAGSTAASAAGGCN